MLQVSILHVKCAITNRNIINGIHLSAHYARTIRVHKRRRMHLVALCTPFTCWCLMTLCKYIVSEGWWMSVVTFLDNLLPINTLPAKVSEHAYGYYIIKLLEHAAADVYLRKKKTLRSRLHLLIRTEQVNSMQGCGLIIISCWTGAILNIVV